MSEIQSLARGLQIIDALRDEKSVSVTDLAKRLELNKSSVSRLVKTLVQHGYAAPDPHSRAYLPGDKLTSSTFSPGLREAALPFLRQLVELTGESAHTAIYSQGKALITNDLEPDVSLKVSGGVGRLAALHCTAVGKCLLAFMPLPLPDCLAKRTKYTLISPEGLEADLQLSRDQGYAFDNEENYLGVRCLAAPIHDASGAVVACLGISGPTVRMPLTQIPTLAEHVIQMSLELSESL